LYAETLSVNENAIPANIKSSVQKLAQMQSGKYFRLDALRLKVNNELAALTLLIEDGKTANLVFNLVAREFREFGIMTHMVTNAILLSRDLDLETFDFNGANSPNRALDKHSYGSRQVLFFRIQVDW
jgi:lipid II:glycine glycyltransferase (peptidoglycan interpeptide bridge formation enzyme)